MTFPGLCRQIIVVVSRMVVKWLNIQTTKKMAQAKQGSRAHPMRKIPYDPEGRKREERVLPVNVHI